MGVGKYRYLSLAQDLVMSARGKLKERTWKRANGALATIDDISAFVIPILPYKEEYKRSQVRQTPYFSCVISDSQGFESVFVSFGPGYKNFKF